MKPTTACSPSRNPVLLPKSILSLLILALALVARAPLVAEEGLQTLQVPKVDQGANMMAIRQTKQENSTNRFKVFYDFQFTDRQPESGIDFRHSPVEDGAIDYKMVHYDHGNAVVAADVDGDGRSDIFFPNQLGGNQLWKNLGGGRFQNISKEAGVSLADRVSVAASFADYDNDGDPDLFVSTVKMGNVLFENDGKGHFRDVSEKAGIATVAHSSGAVFFDYDLDGWLDLFVTQVGVYTTDKLGPGPYYIGYTDAFKGHLMPERTENNQLFRNLGNGRFEDVTAKVGLEDGAWSGDASFADLNGDLYPDLYVLSMQGDDHYYENMEGKKFVDRTAELFPKSPWGAMGIKFFDFNNDSRMDLILTDMHSDMSQEIGTDLEYLKSDMTWADKDLLGGANNIFGNAFWVAGADGKYEEQSDRLGTENYWPWGLSVADLNADGFEDVFIAASMSFPFRYGINSVLLNNLGQEFLASEFLLGVEPRREGKTHIPWFRLNCSSTDSEHHLCAGLEGEVEIWGSLGSRSSLPIDLDDDGDLDLVTFEFNYVPQVLVSNLTEKTPVNFLKIRLVGKQSNRDGLGARVEVQAGGQTYVRFTDGKSGYLAQSSLPLYFGLGKSRKIDRVEVVWPSGIRQTVTDALVVNQLLEIEEKASPST